MVIYRKWIDFVIYGDAYLVYTPEQRIDTTEAIEPYKDGDKLPTDTKSIMELVRLTNEKGLIIKEETAVKSYDEFEAMEINHKGDVTIWTKRKIGYLIRAGSERMVYLDRHPPSSNDDDALSPVSKSDDPLTNLTSKLKH